MQTIIGALQDGRGWEMDLHFLFIFSEDATMRIFGALQARKGWETDPEACQGTPLTLLDDTLI